MSPVIFRLSLCVFLVLLIQGSALGLSDDEAYYWVLAQTPSFGYAFHPPGVAWLILFFQKCLGFLSTSIFSTFLVRFPAALLSSLTFALSLMWIELSGKKVSIRAGLVVLSFTGFFALSWMIVPDILLFFALTLLFVSTFQICFGKWEKWAKAGVAIGACLLLLSKYSGILGIFSAGTSFLVFLRGDIRWKALSYLIMGSILGAIPTIIWNYSHDWASLFYQIHDRHVGTSPSLIRYLRFWGSQILLAGPVLIGFAFLIGFRFLRGFIGKRRGQTDQDVSPFIISFTFIWMALPGAIFCIQPLFSDFKIHWAFVVWWPACLVMARYSHLSRHWKWMQFQVGMGLTISSLIFMSCQFPVIHSLYSFFSSPKKQWDPKWDVTNDFYAWPLLRAWLDRTLSPEDKELPVVGSRYQTAAQASFVLKDKFKVSFIPRSPKEFDEWPRLHVSDSEGPEWPNLQTPILYVLDQRYDLLAHFLNSHCTKLGRIEDFRGSILAKWIEIWRCAPKSNELKLTKKL